MSVLIEGILSIQHVSSLPSLYGDHTENYFFIVVNVSNEAVDIYAMVTFVLPTEQGIAPKLFPSFLTVSKAYVTSIGLKCSGIFCIRYFLLENFKFLIHTVTKRNCEPCS